MTDELIGPDGDVFADEEAFVEPAIGPEWISLPATDLLSIQDADQLLRWRHAAIVAVIGERGGGKTTLVTEIYERFLRGPFAGQSFSFSQSLSGFERKSHQSRATSGRSLPSTPRTSASEGLSFFHLSLVAQQNERRADLLISERAGETYREARDTPERARALIEVAKAKTVAFIIDGERVANDRTRPEALSSVRGMIRAFSEVGAIPCEAEIQVVTTKFDLLDGEDTLVARQALEDFEGRFTSTWQDRYAKVSTWRTAARDPEGQVEPAWGVAPLLLSWLAPMRPRRPTSPALPPLENELDRLLLR